MKKEGGAFREIRKSKGYSLLELAIVISIISFTIGNLLSLAKDRTEAEKITETYEKMDFVEKSIAAYFAENGSIPCPASIQKAEVSTNFGASTRGSTPYNCTISYAASTYYNASFPGLALGAVPTAELQIPDDYAYDAWGRRFTYSMIQQCNTSNIQNLAGYNYGGVTASNSNYNSTSNFSMTTSSTDAYNCGVSYAKANAIEIQNASGTVTSNAAVYVLLSHGRNGHGAYPHNGGTSRITSSEIVSTNEVTNALLSTGGSNAVTTGIYIQQPISFSNSATTYFDDIVHYRTKDQLIKEAGGFNASGIYSSSICNMAANVTSTTSAALYCPFSLTTPTSCQTQLYELAAQITSLCF
jgi:type II secretory pathway pseudopilin PulG